MCCFTVQRFCCMRLPTAGIVIGWVSTKISLILLVIYAMILANREKYAEMISVPPMREQIAFETAIAVVMTVYIAMTLLNLVASILLIIGTKKNSHLMLLPWLINNGIKVVYLFLVTFALLIGIASNPNLAGPLLVLLIILGIKCWVWITVHSLFKNIRTTRAQALSYGNVNIYSSKLELVNNPALRY